MFEVIPNVKQDPVKKKPVHQKINELLQGTYTKPFGFYDFIIVGTASFLYFFFTGIAVMRGRHINSRWLSIGYKLDGGKIVKGIKKKILREPEVKPNSIKVETINKPTPQPFS